MRKVPLDWVPANFAPSQIHSSIDEALALSHRVGVTAARLIGCIPRPTGTALTMSSDS